MNDRFLRACHREWTDCVPVWFMRQAGRYMEEYRAVRAKHSILEVCKTPELAAQVTLQPIERFPLDAAIIFADILLPLEPMGLRITFEEGEGPVIHNPVRTRADVDEPERVHIRTGPDRIVNDRTFAFLERDAEAHRLEREQDVGKDDRRIERKPLDRLQRDLRRQFRRLAYLEDGMLGADGPVFLHIAPGLSHEPHRHAVRPFTVARSEKTIVHKGAF